MVKELMQGGEQVAQAPEGAPQEGGQGLGLGIKGLQGQDAGHLQGMEPRGGPADAAEGASQDPGRGPVRQAAAVLRHHEAGGHPQQPAGVRPQGFPILRRPDKIPPAEGQEGAPGVGQGLIRRAAQGTDQADEPDEGSMLPQPGPEKAKQPHGQPRGKTVREIAAQQNAHVLPGGQILFDFQQKGMKLRRALRRLQQHGQAPFHSLPVRPEGQGHPLAPQGGEQQAAARAEGLPPGKGRNPDRGGEGGLEKSESILPVKKGMTDVQVRHHPVGQGRRRGGKHPQHGDPGHLPRGAAGQRGQNGGEPAVRPRAQRKEISFQAGKPSFTRITRITLQYSIFSFQIPAFWRRAGGGNSRRSSRPAFLKIFQKNFKKMAGNRRIHTEYSIRKENRKGVVPMAQESPDKSGSR